MTRSKAWTGGIIAVAVVFAACAFFAPHRAVAPGDIKDEVTPEDKTVEVVAKDLNVPWDIAFLPDGDMLVTERPGQLRRLGKHPATMDIPGVIKSGEGGLMGIALHPNFSKNHFVYLYFTTSVDGQTNKIDRFTLNDDNTLSKDKTILEAIPSSIYHDGGQLAFGPDGMLYITTGDAQQPELAPNLSSLAGKILRLTPDGDIPNDNPFKTAVWSYGHRNPQGIAWDNQGRLWATEHGRSGVLSGFDELNLIERGKNYGWPDSQGTTVKTGTVGPVLQSGASTTWAPSGIAYANGKLFFAGLRGVGLYEVSIDVFGHATSAVRRFPDVYGRLRAVVLGPDGALYVTTSNRDGRGKVQDGDDKIIRIPKSAQ
jgi:glucose/arabinose dehydrogenase